jgi:hypothetical protein
MKENSSFLEAIVRIFGTVVITFSAKSKSFARENSDNGVSY